MSTILEGYSKREIGRLRTRFWAHIHPDGRDHDLPADACWEWRGGTFKDGAPAAGTKHRVYAARYLAYALAVEDFDSDSLYVLATCGNRHCVNPSHMRLAIWRPENDVPTEMKTAAVAAVTKAVWQDGTLPRVVTQRCAACGQPAAQYHHYLGYAPEHWLDVIPMCRRCHKRDEWQTVEKPEGIVLPI